MAINAITATGNSQATAAPLPPPLGGMKAQAQAVTTPGGGGGVVLPAFVDAYGGVTVTIFNNAAGGTLSIYPQPGGSINVGTTDAAVTLATGKFRTFYALSPLDWICAADITPA